MTSTFLGKFYNGPKPGREDKSRSGRRDKEPATIISVTRMPSAECKLQNYFPTCD